MSDSQTEPEHPAPESVLLTVPSEYGPALDRLIALATHEIVVFDRDLKEGNWGSPERAAALHSFFLANRRSRMEIIVHDTLHTERALPRLVLLLRSFSHKFSILRTVGEIRNASDAFAIADSRHFLHRFHIDASRGELSIDNPKKARVLRERYDEILVFTEPGVNATQLGL